MEIRDLIFLDKIIEKLDRKHRVRQQEVEEIFFQLPYFRFVEKGNYRDENVYAAFGQTYAGRYLIIFFVYKQNKNALISEGYG